MRGSSESRRSCLSVTGSSPRFLAKAQVLDADQVLLDLEDAVAPDAKPGARGHVITALTAGDWGGKVITVRVNGATTRWAYDAAGHITAVTNPDGDVTSYRYSAAGRLLETTDATGASTTYGYDAGGNLTGVTDPTILHQTGDPRLVAIGAVLVGLVLAGCGYVVGRVQLARGRRTDILTTGLSAFDIECARRPGR